MSAVDLMAFREMVRVAYLCDVAYAAAVEEGPCVPGDKDVVKSGAAWRSYLNANAAYRASLARFGLDPKSRKTVPLLPGMPGNLRVVDDDD
jgi:hypothetical protein